MKGVIKMRKIAHWIDRPHYSIAENIEGKPVGVLMPIESCENKALPFRGTNTSGDPPKGA